MYEETSFGDNLLFIADRTKGYWEAVVISEYSTHYNFQTIIMKNDLTYTYNYSVDNNLLDSVTIINGDRTADIINFNGSSANLYLGSLKGIKSFEIETNSIVSATSGKEGDVYEFEDGSYATTGRKSATINLTNGNKIEEFDTYVDGKIEVGRTLVLTGAQGYSAELMIKIAMKEVVIEGEPVVDPNNPENYIPGRPITEYQEYSLDEKMDFIEEFLNEAGFSYSYNFNYIISSLKYASSEMNSFVNFYKINGYNVNSRSELSKAFNEERAKHRDIISKLNSYSSFEEIDINDQDKMKDNMLFPSVKNITSNNVTNTGSQIKVTNLSLAIDDTMLMVVDNEQYTIGIGVVDISTDIINYYPVYLGNETITYSGADTFTASTTGEFNVSVDEEGEYSLVAYIATKDGIRVSKPVYIPFSSINEYRYSQNRLECTYALNSDNYLIIKQSYLNDVNVTASLNEVNTYDLLETILTNSANEYGIVEQYDIYTLQGEEWVKVYKETANIIEGSYKLEFLIFNEATDNYSTSSVILNLK